MTREIPMNHGLVALVDDADYELAMRHRWHRTDPNGRRTVYAATNMPIPGRHGRGSYRYKSLHHLITGWSMVDHINGNGLDNRRSNLRQVTHAQNCRNRRLNSDNTSGYKGVNRFPSSWRAGIVVNQRFHHLGMYATAEEAALAYDEGARRLHGEFARLNFPDPPTLDVAPMAVVRNEGRGYLNAACLGPAPSSISLLS